MGDRPPAGGRRHPQVRLARMGDGPDGSPCPRRGAPDRAGGPARRPVVRGGGLRPPRGANRVGAAVSRRRGVLDICARELAPRKIYRCSIRAVRGCRRLRGFVSCEERKACWHLFRLYDAGAHLVWNSYAVPLIFVTGIGSQLAGADETLVRCGHEGSFAKGQWQPIFSADEHPAAFAGRNSRQDRRSNPTMPSRTEFMPVGSELVIATHPAAGLGMQPSHTR